jgi:hypothetical protein
MDIKEISPTSGAAGQAIGGASSGTDRNELSTVNAVCDGVTAKAILVRSKSGNTAWIPLSQITVVSGEPVKGSDVSLLVPKWILDQARQRTAQPKRDVAFTSKVLVTGVLMDRSEKALKVRCDADMVSRWLALSKIDIEGDFPVVAGNAVRAIVPAWVLKHKDGYFPSWVAGAVL